MPQSVLSFERVQSLLARPLSEARLEEILDTSKAELEGHEGGKWTISVTPDRLDLLSEGGLALFLQGALEEAKGLPPLPVREPGGRGPQIDVDRSVDPLRPEISAVIVRPTQGVLDPGLLEEAIRFQEIVQATVGRDRRRSSLGIYAADRLAFPLRYALEPISEIRFQPLGTEGEWGAERFLAEHPMALRYGPLGRSEGRALVLRDARNEILSLPPILNGNGSGAVHAGDGSLLLESTGTQSRAVSEALALMLVVFAARGYSVTPVAIAHGAEAHDGRSLYSPRRTTLPSAVLAEILGSGLSASEVEHFAARARLSAHPVAGGWEVAAPPWRIDLLGPVDAAEEVLLARGLAKIEGVLPPSSTRRRRRPMTRFANRFGTTLLGLGFAALFTPVLVSDAAAERVGRARECAKIANPPSQEYGRMRSALQISLLESLRRNTRYGYPQMLSEVGPVVRLDAANDAPARTIRHAGFVVARDRCGFADAAATVEYLLRTVDVIGIRESATLPGTIPGRGARVRIAGETVAEIGEIHPSVLEAIKVPVAVAWGEVDLSALAPLVGTPKAVK